MARRLRKQQAAGVTPVLVDDAAELVLVEPDSPLWKDPSQASCEYGAIVWLRPPADGEVAPLRQAFADRGAQVIRVAPPLRHTDQPMALMRKAGDSDDPRKVALEMVTEARGVNSKELAELIDELLSLAGL